MKTRVRWQLIITDISHLTLNIKHHPSYIIHLSDSTGGTNVRSSILPARTINQSIPTGYF